MKKLILIVLFITLLTTLTACAGTTLGPTDSQIRFTTPSANPQLNLPGADGYVAGFGTGIWHGFLSIITLFISFLNPAVQMYEVHNNGSLYNFGFLLGVALLFASIVFVRSRSRG